MDEEHSENREPQVASDEALLASLVGDDIAESLDHAAWSDERFLQWLAQREGRTTASSLATTGRRLIVRAHCRWFGVRLFAGAPSVVHANSSSAEPERLAPLIDLTALTLDAPASSAGALIVPPAWSTSRCVACRVSTPIDCFAPFVEIGDTMLVALAAPRRSPALTLRQMDGRRYIADDADAGELLGAIIALWSNAMV